jgi:hypothetical protein
MARGKYLGFAFAVLLGLVLLHSSIVMRGPVSFAGVLVGAIVLLIIPLVDAYFPGVQLWSWIRYGVYELPSVYISMHGYLFIATLFFLIWLGGVWFYDRRTYIEVAPGQFRVRQEIGQEDIIYDVTLMTFEKRRDDFFHHKILGLGFLRHLGLGFLTTGTGDLAFRPGGTKAQIVYWPNVWNVQRVLARLEDMLAEREVV